MPASTSLDLDRAQSRPAALPAAPFDFQRVVGSLRRHARLFSGVSLAVAATVAALTLSQPPGFTASATLLINDQAPDAANLNTITPAEAQAQATQTNSAAVDTEVEILKSRSLATRVVDRLNLIADPDFNGSLRPPSFAGKIKGEVHGLVFGEAPPVDPAVKAFAQHEGVVNAVMSKLAVKRTGFSYAVSVVFVAADPNKAAQVANAFAQAYLTQNLDTKLNASKTATSWLDGRLNQLRQQVQTADAAVQQYKIANNLLSASGATLTEQEITNLDSQLAQARAQDAEQDARYETARRQLAQGSNGGDVGEALTNPVIGTLRAQRAQASAHLADLQARYGPKHPEILKAERSLADIDAQIAQEIQRVLSNLKAQSQIAHTRTASIASTAAGTQGRLAGNNQALVHLDELTRNSVAAQSIYDAFLARYKETLAKEGTQQPDATVASVAKPPISPSQPNKRLDLALALVLGLSAGVAAVLLAELLKRGVSSASEVQQAFDLPFLGEIPTVRSTLPKSARRGVRPDPVQYVVDKPLSRFTEAFRNLRAAIVASKMGADVKVVAVTSSLPGEGKTTTALCLARTSALSGSRVLLVDCDLRKRSINRMFRSEPDKGLLEVLNGTAPLEAVLRLDQDSGAMILPLARSAFTPKDVLGSPEMVALLTQLRGEFDLIILDTPPALAVADTRVLCPHADAVVFLTSWRRTPRKAAKSAIQALESGGTFIAGVALTKVDVREQARSGEGSTHYYRAYDGYYVG